jgi:hypothetical protein
MESRRTEGRQATTGNEAPNSSTEAATSAVQNTNRTNRRRKAVESLKVVGIMILLFTVFTGPFVIYMFMTVFNYHQSLAKLVILFGIATVQSALNPFVYGWRIDPLRNGFKSFFQKCITRPNND